MSARGPRGPREPTDDRWLLVAVGVSAAISALVWGSGWVWPHAGELGPILRGTLSDPSHPGAGWPPALEGGGSLARCRTG